MNTVPEIISAIKRLDNCELKDLALWFEAFIAEKTTKQNPDQPDFPHWRGYGRLPIGKNADDYLRLIRDGQDLPKS